MQCSNCGTRWARQLAPQLKYCGECGVSMLAGTRGAAPVDTRAGELRLATVLFADLASFTSFAEQRSADEVARAVAPFLSRLGETIVQHGGSIDKFIGDAVMATFGIPRADPMATRNAVRAALALQAVAREHAERSLTPFQLRIGVHSGEVMSLTMGNTRTVLGDTVNTASRIQSLAAPGAVWVSKPVFQEVRRFFVGEALPAIEVKGKRQKVEPYEIRGERTSLLVDVPRFVGRTLEMGRLQKQFEAPARSDRLRVVGVRGPAGIGKSRLVWELRQKLESEVSTRVDVIQYDLATRLPAHGLSSIIRNRFDLSPSLEPEAVLTQLRRGFEYENPAIEEYERDGAAQLLATVLGILPAELRPQGVDDVALWESVFIELKRWLEYWTAKGQWLIVLEDAQRGDPETAAFLEWAMRVTWTHSPVIAVTLRDEDFDDSSAWWEPVRRWRGRAEYEEVALKELKPADLSLALASMEPRLSAAEARRIADHAEGNPRFATELVLYLQEQRSGSGGGEAGEGVPGELLVEPLVEQPGVPQLPSNIRAVMEARLERLPPIAREVAKAAALIGRRFSREALARIWRRTPAELEQGMSALLQSGVLYEETSRVFTEETEGVFRHSLLRDAAAARVPRQDRLAALVLLEAWATQKLDAAGHRWEATAVTLLPMMVRARQELNGPGHATWTLELLGLLHRKAHRSREAADAFEQALVGAEGVRQLVLHRWTLEERLAGWDSDLVTGSEPRVLLSPEVDAGPARPAWIHPRWVALLGGALDRWDLLNEADAAVALDVTRVEVLVRAALWRETGVAVEQVRAALDEVAVNARAPLWARWAKAAAAHYADGVGDAARADEACRAASLHVDATGDKQERLALLHAEELVAMRKGELARAHTLVEEQLRLALETHARREEARVWHAKGILRLARGEPRAALECFEHCLQLSRALRFLKTQAVAFHHVGLVHLELGNHGSAQRCQEDYLELSRGAGHRPAEWLAPLATARLAMLGGDTATAGEAAQRALRATEPSGGHLAAIRAGGVIAEVEVWAAVVGGEPERLMRGLKTLRRTVGMLLAAGAFWSEECDLGELVAVGRAAAAVVGEPFDPAIEARLGLLPPELVVTHAWLRASTSITAGDAATQAEVSKEFSQRGLFRSVQLFEQLLRWPKAPSAGR